MRGFSWIESRKRSKFVLSPRYTCIFIFLLLKIYIKIFMVCLYKNQTEYETTCQQGHFRVRFVEWRKLFYVPVKFSLPRIDCRKIGETEKPIENYRPFSTFELEFLYLNFSHTRICPTKIRTRM